MAIARIPARPIAAGCVSSARCDVADVASNEMASGYLRHGLAGVRMTANKTSLSESDAAGAYARMWNRCDLAPFMHLKLARNVTTTVPVWSDGAPAGVRIQTFRGRNMLAAILVNMVERVLAEAMHRPGHTARAELATLDWEGRRRPAVVLGCWDETTSRRVAIFETGPAGVSHVELLLDGGLDLEMSGLVPV